MCECVKSCTSFAEHRANMGQYLQVAMHPERVFLVTTRKSVPELVAFFGGDGLT